MTRLSPFIGLALALVVALTSGAMAVARGQAMAAGTMVLCTGMGPVSVVVDADGQPIGPVHICPDCALHVTDAAVSPAPVLQAPSAATRYDWPLLTVSGANARASSPKARAPPRV